MKIYKLYWVSEDNQASIHIGAYSSEEESWDAVPEALEELLSHGTKEDRDWIAAGHWEVEEEEEESTN